MSGIRFDKRMIGVAVLVVLAGVVALSLLESDADRIRTLLKSAADDAALTQAEHPFETLGRAKKLIQYFDKEVIFEIELEDSREYEVIGSKRLLNEIAAVRSRLSFLSVTFEIDRLKVSNDTARVNIHGLAIGRKREGDKEFREEHDIVVELRETDDGWKIFRFEGRHPSVAAEQPDQG